MRIKMPVTIIALVYLLAGTGYAQTYTLGDLCRTGLERSETVLSSAESVTISRMAEDKANANLFPTLSAYATAIKYTEDKQYGTFVIQPNEYTTYGLKLEKTLSLSGREFTSREAAKFGVQASRLSLESQREAYALNIATAYYTALRVKKSVEIAQNNVERLRRYRDAANLRVKVGEATKNQLLRAEAELQGAETELTRARNNLMLSRATLSRVASVEEDFDIAEPADGIGETVVSLADLKANALTSRAEIKALAMAVEAARLQVGYSRGAYWPSVTAQAVYSRSNENPIMSTFNQESIYAGLTLNLPLYEAGARRADVTEYSAKLRQAELSLEDSRKSIALALEGAYRDTVTAERSLQSLKSQHEYARENHALVFRQFDAGIASSLDLIDANTLLLNAERQLADAVYQYGLSTLRLKREGGSLLRSLGMGIEGRDNR